MQSQRYSSFLWATQQVRGDSWAQVTAWMWETQPRNQCGAALYHE